MGKIDCKDSQVLSSGVIHTKAGAFGLFELAPETPITYNSNVVIRTDLDSEADLNFFHGVLDEVFLI